MYVTEEKGYLITIYSGIFSRYVLSRNTNNFAVQRVT